MVRRFRKTMADMMVIAISPILIMTMIGSLLFFLLAVLYQGPYETRLAVIFTFFVVAIVLVARISMEEGTEYAALFAIPLALVTLVAMMRFVQIPGPLRSFSLVVNAALIGFVWWCAHKLTWDCTLIDDKQDSSGEGLLQMTKLDASSGTEADGADQDQTTTEMSPELTAAEARDVPWLRRLIDRHRRPHAPGVWVVYFSLVALPVFGVGQTFIPATDEDTRRRVFHLFCLFVASALGLLVTTSFLGLRRYLRQRNLQMPADMAAVWLGVGAIVIVGLLALTVLLPRPGAALAISQPPFTFKSLTEIRPSSFGFGNDGPESADEATQTRADAKQIPSSPNGTSESEEGGSGQQSRDSKSPSGQTGRQESGKAESDPNGRQPGSEQSGSEQGGSEQGGSEQGGSEQGGSEQSGSEQGGSEQSGSEQSGSEQGTSSKEKAQQDAARSQGASNPSRNQSKGKNDNPGRDDVSRSNKTSNDRTEETASQKDAKSEAKPESHSNDQPPESTSLKQILSKAAGGLASLIKALFFLLLVGAGIFLLWKYRDGLVQGFRQLLADLRRLFGRLFGRSSETESQTAPDEDRLTPPHQPFSEFADPFLTETASRHSTEQLVRYSFEALEAWATDRSCGREIEQTPVEFAQHIGDYHPRMGRDAQVLADLYSRIAYGHERVSAGRQADLRRLWQQMRTSPPPAPR